MKRFLILIVLLVLIVGGLAVWWKNGLSPVNNSDKQTKIFVVEKGTGLREISNGLKSENLIKDPVVFFLLTKLTGFDKKIEAGDFRLSPSMSTEETMKALTHGTLDIWVTIPEGKRADEIADILKTNLPTYKESWRPILKEKEGYLFPDTYLFNKESTIDQVVSKLTENFDMKYKNLSGPSLNKFSKAEIVTIASMIEREAKHDKDRSMVASVILNRLEIGMGLQIDATIQYALGYQQDEQTWWKKGLTANDLKLNSPFNTYKNTGLPPTPISNPGFSALEAVANPADTNYLYYISDANGVNHYAKTLAEHNANIAKYGL
jgi:UPF0755 protein